MGFSKIDYQELQRRIDFVEWQISIAKERQTLENREQRLKELKIEISKRQPKL